MGERSNKNDPQTSNYHLGFNIYMVCFTALHIYTSRNQFNAKEIFHTGVATLDKVSSKIK